jgi:hypothetical protein
MGGMVLETNMSEITTRIDEQNKLEKQEVSLKCLNTRFGRISGSIIIVVVRVQSVYYKSFSIIGFQIT